MELRIRAAATAAVAMSLASWSARSPSRVASQALQQWAYAAGTGAAGGHEKGWGHMCMGGREVLGAVAGMHGCGPAGPLHAACALLRFICHLLSCVQRWCHVAGPTVWPNLAAGERHSAELSGEDCWAAASGQGWTLGYRQESCFCRD